jgi:hypothetical protein
LRRKKAEKLKIESFWSNFLYFNKLAHLEEITPHLRRVNFRLHGVNDEGLLLMMNKVKSIDMLDLDETAITNEGIRYLLNLTYLKELRLKGCNEIDEGCLPYLNQMHSLELLHLGSTAITVDGIFQLSSLTNLHTLLLSAPTDNGIQEKVIKLSALHPQCEFIVNHKTIDPKNTQ